MKRVFLAGLLAAAFAAAAPRPNVLFIIVDDLRPQLGCYGVDGVISPNIDRLASEGTLFERAVCQVPVCGASRASLLTGLYPTSGRFVTYYTKAQEDAPGIADIPTLFMNNGYTTISNGKIYHHADDNTNSWNELHRPKDFRVYLKPENQGKEWAEMAAYEDADVEDNAYPGGALADKVIGDLRRAKEEGAPFFITAGFTKPHLPFNAPKKYWDMYDRSKIDLADNPFAPQGAPGNALHQWNELRDHYGGMPKEGPLPDELARTLIHGYLACVSYTDAQIGKLLDELDRLNMRDDTIVVLIGDHGWQLGEHSLWCKHALFNTSTIAPLMISAPGCKAGQRTDALVEFVDLYPTLCELAGLDAPQHLLGKSMVPLLNDVSKSWKKAAFSRYHTGESVMTDRYSYTEWSDGARMLYDHKTDPDENVNVSENPENKRIVQQMKKLLWEHRAAVAAPAPKQMSLKDVYKNDFMIGCALRSAEKLGAPDHVFPVAKEPRELAVMEREFNVVTAENLMKPQYMRPAPGEFNFEQADEFVDLAEQYGLEVVGHVLVWHAQTPEWFFQDENGETISRQALIERLREHIHTIVGSYKGRIKYWDVVNEAVDTREVNGIAQEAFFRKSKWLEIIGPEFIELAFQFAHEADPEAELVYNDYSMTHKSKVDFVAENIVKRLKEKGIAIHGVGMQAHWHLEYPRPAEIEYAIKTLSDAGVHISITELDVGVLPLADGYQGADVNRRIELQEKLNPYKERVPAEVLEEQAQKYRQVFEVLLEHRRDVERVTFWGVSDRDSWKNNHPVRGRTAYPLLFDRDFQPKPAYRSLIDLR